MEEIYIYKYPVLIAKFAVYNLALFILILGFPFPSYSQKDSLSVNPLKEEIPSFPKEFEEIGLLRFKANHFYHKLIQITEPGVVSSLWDLNDNSSNKNSYILHGDIYLPVGMGGYGWRIGNKIIHTLQFIPQVKVRILRDDQTLGDISLPVRTPSFIPRIVWNISNTKFWKYHEMKWSYYGAISAFHHSNGQDGNEFNRDGSINTYNGNFGEDVAFEFRIGGTKAFLIRSIKARKGMKNLRFLRKSYHNLDSIRIRKEARASKKTRLVNVPYNYINEVNHRIAFEWHPKGLSNRAFKQYDLYGRYRINYLFNFRKIKKYQSVFFNRGNKERHTLGDRRWEESYRMSIKASLIAGTLQTGNINSLNDAKIEDRLNLHVSFYWMFKGSNNAAIFMRGSYMGSDEYNIYFQDRVWLGRLGLAFGFFNHS
ncbi:hypothetical protein QQ008_14145 [Fulvivirgaceae bacterium BMA10]|uniref:Phosphatidylcholine 1-acylhydrolase n=1 Tax=Splendidivirga corallicola TaxID=3051826 RepID=A0ABT8KP60_9BACT|nr:hypothetical protein [Fulvivirgaceae bacterium BMA10]